MLTDQPSTVAEKVREAGSAACDRNRARQGGSGEGNTGAGEACQPANGQDPQGLNATRNRKGTKGPGPALHPRRLDQESTLQGPEIGH
jgi:hypothetical protein